VLAGVVAMSVGLTSYLIARDLNRLQDRHARDQLAAVYGPVFADPIALPAFELTERSGATWTRDDLAGSPWVGIFVFSRCPSSCPRMLQAMSEIQEAWRELPHWEDVRLVTISVDPEHDRPEVLQRIAEKYDADDERWLMFTGTRRAIWELCKDGFQLNVSEDPGAVMPISHSTKFVLVDQHSQIRGYYEALAPQGRALLRSALERLMDDPRAQRIRARPEPGVVDESGSGR
jgi:protein SCO1/2